MARSGQRGASKDGGQSEAWRKRNGSETSGVVGSLIFGQDFTVKKESRMWGLFIGDDFEDGVFGLWFDDLMFRWDFSSLRCTWDVIKPWDIHHTPLHRGPPEAVCSTFGGFEDLSKGSHRESGIGGWKMGVFLPRWWAQNLWDCLPWTLQVLVKEAAEKLQTVQETVAKALKVILVMDDLESSTTIVQAADAEGPFLMGVEVPNLGSLKNDEGSVVGTNLDGRFSWPVLKILFSQN